MINYEKVFSTIYNINQYFKHYKMGYFFYNKHIIAEDFSIIAKIIDEKISDSYSFLSEIKFKVEDYKKIFEIKKNKKKFQSFEEKKDCYNFYFNDESIILYKVDYVKDLEKTLKTLERFKKSSKFNYNITVLLDLKQNFLKVSPENCGTIRLPTTLIENKNFNKVEIFYLGDKIILTDTYLKDNLEFNKIYSYIR